MSAKKTTTGSSTPKKKAAKKKATPGKKKAAAKKKAAPAKKRAADAAPKKAASKESVADTPIQKEAQPAAPPVRPEGSVSSMDVTLGHVFSLKPRVNKSFRSNDLSQARRALADRVYADLAEAARAVAEEALSITRGAANRPEKRRR
jgi:hypothetical protein